MSIDLTKYLDNYILQTKEELENLSNAFLIIENNPEDKEAIDECFRFAHTIKGNAATMMFNKTAELAHSLENLLDAVRSNRLEINPIIMDTIFQCIDTLELLIEKSKDKTFELDISDIMNRIQDHISDSEEPKKGKKAKRAKKAPAKARAEKGKKKAPRKKSKKEEIVERATTVMPDDSKEVIGVSVRLAKNCNMKSARSFIALRRLESMGRVMEISPSRELIESEKFDGKFVAWIRTEEKKSAIIMNLSSIKDVEEIAIIEGKPDEAKGLSANASSAAAKKSMKEIQSIRVKMNRLDDLLDCVGELVISKIQLAEIGKEVESRPLNEAIQSLDRLASELQFNVLRIRMVPIEVVFSRFPRMIRDLSRQMGKDIELVMEGHEIELDRSVMDKLGDLLVHMIRNSIDHGIENIKERIELGKNPTGTIRLSASQEQNRVVIIIEDDGRGINIGKVRKKALESGLRNSTELNSMRDEEVINLLGVPGFSTAEEVTNISGRGVGLDAVKSGIDSLGGQMEIESQFGNGTRITLSLPLTLAIIVAMMVRVKNDVFAIPIDPIIETVSVNESDLKLLGGMKVIKFRGEVTPLIYLSRALGVAPEDSGSAAIIVSISHRKSGIVVDELLGQQEIVVKPLDSQLRECSFFGGATILGSGEVALILDVLGLIRHSQGQILKTVREHESKRENKKGGLSNA